MLLAGQIGMVPGLMATLGSVDRQFDQIITNFSRCLIQVLGPNNLTEE